MPSAGARCDVVERGLPAVADQHVLVEAGVARRCSGSSPLQEFAQRIAQGQLVLIDSSMLMRSMPSQ
jgi:hypothetical protein